MLLTFNSDSLEKFDTKRISENILIMRDSADNQRELTSMLTSYRQQAREVGKGKEFDELVSRINEANPTDELAIRYEYEFSDFSESETPYWDVFNQPTTLLRIQRLEVLASEAKEVGYKSFKKSYGAFQKNLRKLNVRMDGTSFQNPTTFPGQPMELDAGDWRCDAMGVVRETGNGGTETACIHPIMPVERYVNIDTGEEKIKIAYFNGKYWRDAIISKLDAFDASKVIRLAAIGVSVTTKTARALADYLCYIEGKNKDIIPETESVSRLGYIGSGEQFSPYVEKLVFDGDTNYSTIYDAVTEHGNYDKWLETAENEYRKDFRSSVYYRSLMKSLGERAEKALKLADDCLGMIGRIFPDIQNYPQAKAAFQQAEEEYDRVNELMEIVHSGRFPDNAEAERLCSFGKLVTVTAKTPHNKEMREVYKKKRELMKELVSGIVSGTSAAESDFAESAEVTFVLTEMLRKYQ